MGCTKSTCVVIYFSNRATPGTSVDSTNEMIPRWRLQMRRNVSGFGAETIGSRCMLAALLVREQLLHAHSQQFYPGDCCKKSPAVVLLVVFVIHFHGTAAAAGLVSSCPLLAICALSLLPVAFLSDAPTTKPMHGSPARALVNRCDKLRLELARWFTTWFQAGGRRTASRREESLHTRTQ